MRRWKWKGEDEDSTGKPAARRTEWRRRWIIEVAEEEVARWPAEERKRMTNKEKKKAETVGLQM